LISYKVQQALNSQRQSQTINDLHKTFKVNKQVNPNVSNTDDVMTNVYVKLSFFAVIVINIPFIHYIFKLNENISSFMIPSNTAYPNTELKFQIPYNCSGFHFKSMILHQTTNKCYLTLWNVDMQTTD